MHHTYLNYGRGLDICARPQTPSNMRRSGEALKHWNQQDRAYA